MMDQSRDGILSDAIDWFIPLIGAVWDSSDPSSPTRVVGRKRTERNEFFFDSIDFLSYSFEILLAENKQEQNNNNNTKNNLGFWRIWYKLCNPVEINPE